MMGALLTVGYVVVWLLYGWRLSVALLDAEVKRLVKKFPNLYARSGGAAEAAAEERSLYLVVGFALACFWPVVMPARGVYRLAGIGLFVTPTELAEAEHRELESLRKLARENGLPMPGFEERS